MPYLASHYEEIYVIDYRYYEGGVKNLVKINNITDLDDHTLDEIKYFFTSLYLRFNTFYALCLHSF